VLRDALHIGLPAYRNARIEAADLTDIKPTEYRADLVVVLTQDKPVYGIIVEVQLARSEHKPFAWPAYVANLRARFRCPVCLLVVTASDAVARWAAQRVAMGGGNSFAPLVLGPSGVPKVTSTVRARIDPELAVLSTVAHGRDADTRTSVRIARAALAAIARLDEDRSRVYYDLIIASLDPSMKQALRMMNLNYKPGVALREFFRDIAIQEQRAYVVIRLLETRFGSLSARTRKRIGTASLADLDRLAVRLLTAPSLREALGPKFTGRSDARQARSAREVSASRAASARRRG
jgi:hypothetical protein